MNNNPNYVLKTNEAVLMSKSGKNNLGVLKIAVWIVIAVIVIGSIIFQNNLFSEITWPTRLLLIAVAIGVAFVGGKKENVPSPIELQFYEDCLIIYRPKRYYSRKVTRMEINKMMYSDIKRCVYKAQSKRVHIYGNVFAQWYNFDSNGNISKTPTYDRFVTDTLCYFSTRCAEGVNFKQIIEENSPIQVIVEDR